MLNREKVENEKSEAIVSALAVAFHLKIKSVMSTCVALMKEDLDETVS